MTIIELEAHFILVVLQLTGGRFSLSLLLPGRAVISNTSLDLRTARQPYLGLHTDHVPYQAHRTVCDAHADIAASNVPFGAYNATFLRLNGRVQVSVYACEHWASFRDSGHWLGTRMVG